MRTLIIAAVAAVALPALASPLADLASPLADLGTFELDPVVLLQTGEQVPGRQDLEVRHGQFTYRFASPESKAAFEDDPARFAIRQGGACPRMGALSGCGRPDLWTVYEGRLYLSASPGCRATFEGDPERFIERDDPAPIGTDEQHARGAALLERALAWAGGRDALLALDGYSVSMQETVESGGTIYDHRESVVIDPPARMRTVTWWNERSWTRAVSGEGGFFDDGSALRVMDADQLAEGRRVIATQLPVILSACAGDGAKPVWLGADGSLAGERVAVHLLGKTNELVIDPTTGAVVAQRFRGWGGERSQLGAVELQFTAFADVGVKIPTGWHAWFDGERDEGNDRDPRPYTVAPIARVDDGAFALPG